MSKAKDLRGREKAAILLVALGPEVSSMVYKHLDDATIELLTLEIANMRRITASLQVRPFDFVRHADPSQLISFIQGEHPQTIALILSYLAPEQAAQVLGGLPPSAQWDVARRVARMDRITPEVLREVERVLERKLSTVMGQDFTMAGGVDAVVAIINRLKPDQVRSDLRDCTSGEPKPWKMNHGSGYQADR